MWNSIHKFGLTEEEISDINEQLWVEERKNSDKPCHDCGCAVGDVHEWGCDVARCTKCGGQELSCNCGKQIHRDVWDGMWPGTKECYEQKLICCWDDSKEWTYDFNELARRRHGN